MILDREGDLRFRLLDWLRVVFGLGNDGLAAAELKAVDLEAATRWIVELATGAFEMIVNKRFESDMTVLEGFLF